MNEEISDSFENDVKFDDVLFIQLLLVVVVIKRVL